MSLNRPRKVSSNKSSCAPEDTLTEDGCQLIYSNADFIVVDKPAGSNLHRNDRGESLVDRLKKALGLNSLFLVHRLDDDTSGLLMLAKHPAAAQEFGRLFANDGVAKCYVALADGKPKKKQGRVVGDLLKARNGNYRLSQDRVNPSRTHFFSYSLSPGRRLYLLRPYTGKTHQLRVVMKSLGVPILGDRRYGPAEQQGCWDRLYLHAYSLQFSLAGQPYEFQRLPTVGREFAVGACQAALLDLASPWSLAWPDRSCR
ncbi:pseudouridine synthase [Spongiibacter taiwanensis]|uniref:pseudouridine synthase n=1 Tax=Spongiibacter taiwanensis TaxID=1748242 RepID=UPI0020354098|nr:pseudouridine synthase [Spongiibacter taiwanensis]USA43257.1 pseudouridine synthase [Spongiibacter taiwanensis]